MGHKFGIAGQPKTGQGGATKRCGAVQCHGQPITRRGASLSTVKWRVTAIEWELTWWPSGARYPQIGRDLVGCWAWAQMGTNAASKQMVLGPVLLKEECWVRQ